METAPKPVGSWPFLGWAVLACFQRVGVRGRVPPCCLSSRQASTAALAPQEAPVPGHHFIYRTALLGSFLHLLGSSPSSEHLALFLPRDGMILMFENSCHGAGCCGCCCGLPGIGLHSSPGDRCASGLGGGGVEGMASPRLPGPGPVAAKLFLP